MYRFLAHYQNMNNGEEHTAAIEFDGQFFPNECECYCYAMRKAYEMSNNVLMLTSVELISC